MRSKIASQLLSTKDRFPDMKESILGTKGFKLKETFWSSEQPNLTRLPILSYSSAERVTAISCRTREAAVSRWD